MMVMVILQSAVNTMPSTEFHIPAVWTYTASWRRPGTPPTCLVHILGSPVAPSTLGLRLGPTLMVIHHSGGENCAANGVFVHLLYRHVQLNVGGPVMTPNGCVHVMVSPAVPSTLGVRLGTTLMVMNHSGVNTLAPMEFSYTHSTVLYS